MTVVSCPLPVRLVWPSLVVMVPLPPLKSFPPPPSPSARYTGNCRPEFQSASWVGLILVDAEENGRCGCPARCRCRSREIDCRRTFSYTIVPTVPPNSGCEKVAVPLTDRLV